MACIIGQPGMGNVKEIARRVLLPSLALFVVVLVTSVGFAAWRGWAGLVAMGIGGSLVVAVNRRDYLTLYRALRSDWHSWSRGAKGELDTALALAMLPDEYLVFHDYHPLDRSGQPAPWNIDHIVIGPKGIFLLDSKNYSRTRIEPADKDPHNRKNVRQTQRNALEFKQALSKWSAGDLDGQFVVPVVVYTQPGAFVVNTREGWVRVIPLKWLSTEVTDRPAGSLDAERAYRIARVLFAQLSPGMREAFLEELDRFGKISKHARDLRMNRREPTTPELRAKARKTEPHPTKPTLTPPENAPTPSASGAAPTTCPLCKGGLIRRTVRRGPRAGTHILGCENFVSNKCRYVYELTA